MIIINTIIENMIIENITAKKSQILGSFGKNAILTNTNHTNLTNTYYA